MCSSWDWASRALLAFLVILMMLYSIFMKVLDPFHLLLAVAYLLVIGIAVAMATAGVGVGWCIAVLMLAPWVLVVGYETIGHRHVTGDVERALATLTREVGPTGR